MRITILENEYMLADDWSAITLSMFQKLCKIPVPKKLQARWDALMDGKEAPEATYKDIVKTFPMYYGAVIEALSDIPKSVIDRIDWTLRDKLFDEYLMKFAVSSTGWPQYEPVGLQSFKFKDDIYFLPESIERGGKIPLAKESIVSFQEASDIMIAIHEWGEKGIDAMASVCAVYLRKEGEEHSDELVINRTEMFKELPMSVVWEVFFCIMRLGIKLKDALELYSREAILNSLLQQVNQE